MPTDRVRREVAPDETCTITFWGFIPSWRAARAFLVGWLFGIPISVQFTDVPMTLEIEPRSKT